jgi:hypothetical protein
MKKLYALLSPYNYRVSLVCRIKNGLQLGDIAVYILSEQSRTPDNLQSYMLRFGLVDNSLWP